MEWQEIPLPKVVVERIERITGALGYHSVAQFVGEAVRSWLEKKESEYDEIQLEREVGRKTLGKE